MRTEMITIRLTSEEKQEILSKSKLLNISTSNYIREVLDNNITTNSMIEKNNSIIPENICNLLTEIQRLRQTYQNININLDDLERMVVKLCQ